MPADKQHLHAVTQVVERQADNLHRTTVRDLAAVTRTLTAYTASLRQDRRDAARTAGELVNVMSLLAQVQRDLGILAGLDQAAELYNDTPESGQE